MDQVWSDRLPNDDEKLELIISALSGGLLLVDANGNVIWVDDNTRRRLNGGLQDVAALLREGTRPSVSCDISALDVTINGEPKRLCIIQQRADQNEPMHEVIASLESAMADTSWLARAIIEKVRTLRQSKRPARSAADLDMLTHREREVLGLICEGRSDVEMSKMLHLSHNTVRNHIASLYRKIGVNRRGAAIIWARERGITCHDAVELKTRGSRQSSGESANY